MRIAEKSVELNFCAGVARWSRRPIIWFGLTQIQEARAGFDVATRVGGRILLFQIKASNQVMKRSGARQFRVSHEQLRALQQRARPSRGIYYVLPEFGDTVELVQGGSPVSRMLLLDVADLPDPLPPPTIGRSKRLRKSGLHYFELQRKRLTIHSDPFEVPVRDARDWLRNLDADAGLRSFAVRSWDDSFIRGLCSSFRGSAVGVIVP